MAGAENQALVRRDGIKRAPEHGRIVPLLPRAALRVAWQAGGALPCTYTYCVELAGQDL
jgi:hypothetical protein